MRRCLMGRQQTTVSVGPLAALRDVSEILESEEF